MRIAIVMVCVLLGGAAVAGPKPKQPTKDAGEKPAKKDPLAPYRKACELDPSECFMLALQLRDEETAASLDEAKKIFAKLCDEKKSKISDAAIPADACFQLGELAPLGKERVAWYRRACDGGSDRGCTQLAMIYLKEQDPASDAAVSTRALEGMCNAGRSIACEFAAQRHLLGEGAKLSSSDAVVWWGKGCDLGDDGLCFQAGRRLYLDAETDAERAVAARFFKKACDAGNKDGCGWLRLACNKGSKEACSGVPRRPARH